MDISRDRVGPVGLVVTSVTSVQFGAALAATLFPLVGPVAVVALRSVTSAAALVAAGRGARPGPSWAQWRVPLALGVVLAGMNTCVYAAVDRLPLGVVITLEFLGPLGVALAASRRRADVLPALGALAGVVLLTWPAEDAGGRAVSAVGVALALLGAVGWALYILLNRELGRQPGGSGGLAVAAVVSAALVTPVAVIGAGRELFQPHVLALGVGVGLLSSALPFTLDRLALRRLRPGPFGVLMSLNPAVATLAGLVVLHQRPAPAQLAGTVLVAVASAAATRAAERYS
jgi:inner membrane transporter RhtA